jgi:hypothetical protein
MYTTAFRDFFTRDPVRNSRLKLFSERWRFAAFANNAQFYDLIMVKRNDIFETWKNL